MICWSVWCMMAGFVCCCSLSFCLLLLHRLQWSNRSTTLFTCIASFFFTTMISYYISKRKWGGYFCNWIYFYERYQRLRRTIGQHIWHKSHILLFRLGSNHSHNMQVIKLIARMQKQGSSDLHLSSNNWNRCICANFKRSHCTHFLYNQIHIIFY